MAANRKPSNVHNLSGAFAHNPDRKEARKDEPEEVGEIGGPPDNLSDAARVAWVELVLLAPANVLCSSDRPFMEYACKIWAEVKASNYVDPKVGIRFEAIIARLGMSPADRSRVSARKKSDAAKDPYAEF